MAIRTDILEEFEEYSTIDYRDSFSINQVYSHFGTSDFDGPNFDTRGFGGFRSSGFYETEAGILRFERLKIFVFTLKESGNIKYAMREARVGFYTAKKYSQLLNNKAEELGLPLIFISKNKPNRPNVVLNEKQVSFIKYLIHKYSTYKVAEMYSVSQGTINQIKQGATWKKVEPAIKCESKIRIINQYLNVFEDPPKNELDLLQEIIPTHEELLQTLVNNRFKDGIVRCPRCCHDKCTKKSADYFFYRCNKCLYSFSWSTGTIYQNTKNPLTVWYGIERYIQENGGDMNQHALSRKLNVTQKTISLICKKIIAHPYESFLIKGFYVHLDLFETKKAIIMNNRLEKIIKYHAKNNTSKRIAV